MKINGYNMDFKHKEKFHKLVVVQYYKEFRKSNQSHSKISYKSNSNKRRNLPKI